MAKLAADNNKAKEARLKIGRIIRQLCKDTKHDRPEDVAAALGISQEASRNLVMAVFLAPAKRRKKR